MVMLEWGSCGQIASTADGRRSGDDCVTPRASATRSTHRPVPCRARSFSRAAPVSADAVLLTIAAASSTAAPWRGAAGIRAPTACSRADRGSGRRSGPPRCAGARSVRPDRGDRRTRRSAAVPKELGPAMEVLGDCAVDQCVLDADFLERVGFVVVVEAPRYFPRLRLELESGSRVEGRRGGRAGAAVWSRDEADSSPSGAGAGRSR